MNGMPLDQFWRCPTCSMGMAMGPPAKITKPPQCSQHGEMEQTNERGFNADAETFRRMVEDNDV